MGALSGEEWRRIFLGAEGKLVADITTKLNNVR
jgi:hypothetical protein